MISRVLGNRIVAFQDLDHDRAGDHEGHQLAIERGARHERVKGLGLGLGQLQALLPDDLEASRFQLLVIAPVRLRRVASGLMIEKVRSTDIGSLTFSGEDR